MTKPETMLEAATACSRSASVARVALTGFSPKPLYAVAAIALFAFASLHGNDAVYAQSGRPLPETPVSSVGAPPGWGGDIAIALDKTRKPSHRIRHIDELGRWGGERQVEDLREALRDEDPDVRRATMRAMMRMGPDRATRDLAALLQQGLKAQAAKAGDKDRVFPDLPPGPERPFGSDEDERLTFPAPEAPDLAWATRALGNSKNVTQVMPHLISALGSPDAIVRQSALAALQKASGLTMGAGRDFLVPQADEATRAKQVESWQNWWETNKLRTPEDWRITGLSSSIPKDRAAAASAIAKANQTSAVPALIEAFRAEGNPLNTSSTSAVREAMARALSDITGVRPEYNPVRDRDQPIEEWVKQHEDAATRWKTHVDTVLKDGVSQFDSLLAAPEAKTRAHALRLLRRLPYSEQKPLRYFELMESDTSTQVRLEAHITLVRAVCVPLPYDFRASADVQKLQLARWRDWLKEFGNKRAEGAASIFLPTTTMVKWGEGAEVPQDVRITERVAFNRSLSAMRARAAEMITIEKLHVAPVLLQERFDEQTALLERVLLAPVGSVPADVNGVLQRNLARLFGTMKISDAAPQLVKRLDLYRQSLLRTDLTTVERSSVGDSEVAAACMLALGEIGPDGLAGLKQVRECLPHTSEPSVRLRAMSAYTLARLDAVGDIELLFTALERDPSQIVKIAAAESAGILALKPENRRIRIDVVTQLQRVAGRAGDSERLKGRCKEIIAILEKS